MTPLPKELREKFVGVACAMSPENLTCDGELPKWKVKQRGAALRRRWRELEKEAGRRVTEEEVWA